MIIVPPQSPSYQAPQNPNSPQVIMLPDYSGRGQQADPRIDGLERSMREMSDQLRGLNQRGQQNVSVRTVRQPVVDEGGAFVTHEGELVYEVYTEPADTPGAGDSPLEQVKAIVGILQGFMPRAEEKPAQPFDEEKLMLKLDARMAELKAAGDEPGVDQETRDLIRGLETQVQGLNSQLTLSEAYEQGKREAMEAIRPQLADLESKMTPTNMGEQGQLATKAIDTVKQGIQDAVGSIREVLGQQALMNAANKTGSKLGWQCRSWPGDRKSGINNGPIFASKPTPLRYSPAGHVVERTPIPDDLLEPASARLGLRCFNKERSPATWGVAM